MMDSPTTANPAPNRGRESAPAIGGKAATILWWVLLIACSAIFLVHFSLIQLGNMPMSPLKLNMNDELDAYINPYFSQTWNFFAPQPIERDTYLVARARYKDPKTGQDVTTNWVEISTPLYAAVARNRITPLFLVELQLANALVNYSNRISSDPVATTQKDGKNYLLPEIPATADKVDLSVLTRTSLATLEMVYPDVKFESIQLGLVHYEYPRFTKRLEKEEHPKLEFTSVAWQPAVWVHPYCCVKSTIFTPSESRSTQ